MDRTEKIITGLSIAGLIGILVSASGKAGRRGDEFVMRPDDVATIPTDRLGASVSPFGGNCGPAYLVANLPTTRKNDQYAPTVSCGGC